MKRILVVTGDFEEVEVITMHRREVERFRLCGKTFDNVLVDSETILSDEQKIDLASTLYNPKGFKLMYNDQ
jgi:hypothetical protein